MSLGSDSNPNNGYYLEAFTQWGSQESWPEVRSLLQDTNAPRRRRTSFAEMKSRGCSVDAAMEEFRMNGFDSPYDPEEDLQLYNYTSTELNGMGLPGMYLRQKSWPAPDATPAVPLPTPNLHKRPTAGDVLAQGFQAKVEEPVPPSAEMVTDQQLQVLSTLPNSVLYYLLKELEQNRVQQEVEPVKRLEAVECRFCKNNGEREAYYRSHRLRWRGRVVCPVLRNYRCRRCGAKGDSAHTLKYCPLASADERLKSAAMMQSVQRARRGGPAPAGGAPADYVLLGDVTASVLADGAYLGSLAPLDPIWEALAKKLML